MTIKASVFKNFFATQPIAVSAETWLEFLECLDLVGPLAGHEVVPQEDKRSLPVFSPVTYLPGTSRGKANVEAVYAFAVDYDDVPLSTLTDVLTYVTERNYAYVLYSSFSNEYPPDSKDSNAKFRFRLMMPLQTPVPAAIWPGTWEALQQQLPHRGDPACKDASRIYGLAYTEQNRVHASFADFADGLPLPVPAPVAIAATPSKGAPAMRIFDADEEWRNFVHAIRNRVPSKHNEWLLSVARAVSKRDVFADVEQGRHQTLLYLTQAMARRWPHIASDVLAESLRPSLQIMSLTQDQFDVDVRVNDVIRMIDGAHVLHAERDEELAELKSLTLSVEPRQPARPGESAPARYFADETPYSDEEIVQIARDQQAPDALFAPTPNATPDGSEGEPAGPNMDLVKRWLLQRWIVHKNGVFWILQSSGYGPAFSKADVLPAIRTRLAAAASAGVSLTSLTAGGAVKTRTADQLIQDYGTPVQDLKEVYGESTSRLSIAPNGSATLVVKAASLRSSIQAKEHKEIQGWLDALFAGPQYDKAMDWIACVPRLTEPIAALYISGPSGVGKNMLSLALARLFHEGGPVDLANVIGKNDAWNGMLVDCPIVVADEAMPVNATFEGVCEFIGTTTRNLRRKFQPDSTLFGATRLLLTANTEDMMSFRQALTRDQLEAVAKRVLHIAVSNKAVDYFEKHQDHYEWLKTNIVSEHLLWIAQTREVKRIPGARFLVEGDASTMTAMLIARNPLFSRVFQFLAKYIIQNGKSGLMGTKTDRPILGTEGTLWVNPHMVWTSWIGFVESYKGPPDLETIQNALQALCPHDVPPDHVEGYWPVRLELVHAWVKRNGVPDKNKFARLEKVLVNTEKRVKLLEVLEDKTDTKAVN